MHGSDQASHYQPHRVLLILYTATLSSPSHVSTSMLETRTDAEACET